ncbi:hypothetical protein K493DRAFT_303587, partial [Basidiobolus meristosporus CBS 931.73]
MVHLTPCKVPDVANVLMEAQCETQLGSIILDDKWATLVLQFFTSVRSISVLIIGSAIWSLWWINRRRTMETTRLYGHNWAIATAMTHIPGVFTLLGSFARIHRFGLQKATASLFGTLILIGIILPLTSLLWSHYIVRYGDIPYQITQVIHLGEHSLFKSVEQRAPLLTSMNNIVYNEKPLLGYDILKKHPLRMTLAELKPVEAHWRWWKLKVHPLQKSCMIYTAEATEEVPDITPSVSFGDDKLDIVQEETVQKCSLLPAVFEFIGQHSAIADNSPYTMESIDNLRLQVNTTKSCRVQYSCSINASITRWEIFTNIKGEVEWYNQNSNYSAKSVKGLITFMREKVQLEIGVLNNWISCGNNSTCENGPIVYATNLVKEAATSKYDMFQSLGRYKPAHMLLQETLGEFTREATLQQAKNATIIYTGYVYQPQFNLIAGLSWLIPMLLAAAIILLSHLKSRNDYLLHR